MTLDGNAQQQLRSIIDRVERLEEEKASIASDIRDVYAEAKSNGYDVKALRIIIRMRKQDTDERAELETILETYMHALGMLADTPLGQAAIARDLPPTSKPKRVDTSDRPFALPPDDPKPPLAMPDIPPELDRRKEVA